MNKKEPRVISSLTEFMEWAEQFKGNYLFRGHSKESYEIEASICRRLGPAYTDMYNGPDDLLRMSRKLIEDARLRGHDLKDGNRLSDLELLAELQHRGAATCLIDFTRNALAALWFACEMHSKDSWWQVKPEDESNGKVFALSGRFEKITPELIRDKNIDHFFKKDERRKYSLYQWEPKPLNSRIAAQQSVFVFGDDDITVESECVILGEQKRDILTSLDNIVGINERTIFPDIDGFAQQNAQDKSYSVSGLDYLWERANEALKEGRSEEAFEHYMEVVSHPHISLYRKYKLYSRIFNIYFKECDYMNARRIMIESVNAMEDNKNYHRSPGEYIVFHNSNVVLAALKIADSTGNWEEVKSDIVNASKNHVYTVDFLLHDYKNIADFEQKYGLSLPSDIKNLLLAYGEKANQLNQNRGR